MGTRKTFIGRLEKGTDWLGYQLNHRGIIAPAARSVEKFVLHCRRLYEQARCRAGENARQRVADYVVRWQCWLLAGLSQPVRHALTGYLTSLEAEP